VLEGVISHSKNIEDEKKRGTEAHVGVSLYCILGMREHGRLGGKVQRGKGKGAELNPKLCLRGLEKGLSTPQRGARV